jgi:hypothetical protein
VKDQVAEIVRSAASPALARQAVREYVQARILLALQRSGAMVPLAFHGGTALRFLYGLPRFSEYLDFALERPDRGYDLPAWLRRVRAEFAAEGYDVGVMLDDRRIVHSAFVRLRGLLFELGLSPHADEILAVKIEVDTRPPAGAGLDTTVVRRHVTLHLQHHDRPSLLAGKLHAVLQRPYAKGRDIFDLVWYLADPSWPPPNLVLLNNALVQTRGPAPPLTETTWRPAVRARLAALDWDRLRADVAPLLEPSADPSVLDRSAVLRLVDATR